MENGITHGGLDTDKEWIVGYILFGDGREGVEMKVRNEEGAVRRWARKVKREAGGEVHVCYEAGPCGYALQRWLRSEGVGCDVVAPSMTPRKPGDQVKTDRRDARKLAELLRAGLLTVVEAPGPEEEAVRDLCRSREDVKEDVRRCRQRLSQFLLRRGYVWREGRVWTAAYWSWIRGLRLEQEAAQAVLEDSLLAIEQGEERLRGIEEKMREVSEKEPWKERVGWLRCYRGIDMVTAMTVVAELHGFERFRTARDLMGFLGLVPSEHSSAGKEKRGRITKMGNAHVRRVLVEASWHYRHRPGVSRALAERRQGQPVEVIALADKAQQRLHRRYWRLVTKGNKPHAKAVVAVARELAGFLWATLSVRYREAA